MNQLVLFLAMTLGKLDVLLQLYGTGKLGRGAFHGGYLSEYSETSV